jgi:hypothetical protein
MPDDLSVTSHVGRDLLQSAGLFKHEHSVVWEYVSNGLEYVDPGTKPLVTARLNHQEIIVQDNGRGMTFDDLGRFFKMHGENIDRRAGRPGRGFFGTGKSAAFGIANCLEVTTIRNGRRSKVRLTRQDIESDDAEDRVPIHVLERDAPTDDANGTLIRISDLNIKKLDVQSVIRHVEKHIAHWPDADVYINHHHCEFLEPPVDREVRASSDASPFGTIIPHVELVLKVAKAPLDPEFQGVAVTSGGVLHETTLAGCEGRPFSNYIFGNVDVPMIATDNSPVPPFDMGRGMKLNPRNELVRATHAFVGMHIESLLRQLEKEDRDRRRLEEAKKLQKEADQIADLINQDFQAWSAKIRKVVSATAGKADDAEQHSGQGDAEFLAGEGDILADLLDEEGGTHIRPPGPGPAPDEPSTGPLYEESETGEHNVDRHTGEVRQKRKRGGFNVEFRNMGKEEARAKYERTDRTIFVNLDHPQIAAALQLTNTEDTVFRRLAYEVAFTEYAIALASELAGTGYFIDPMEPVTEIRETVNRLARSAAALYKTARF